ncbi:hypothetical protein V495_04216 [Pseudogymnoascus sp. VKM F-4514 (FW-929)]|nr:hypothetical protein V495_04216 [Pseudogymnoascus sp. VKM F-4514 (FW-929)]KFY57002.1 hypothetical protein V497_05832 [Pseudogymnoascus sp. VKM F-4516 (FW-969)]
MLFSKTFSLGVAMFAMSAYAQGESPIKGYGVVPITWGVEVSPGKTVELNGTVQDLIAKINNDHPESEFASALTSKLAQVETRMTEEEFSPVDHTNLFKRDDVLCCNFGKPCQNDIIVGIKYLRGVGGQPTNGPGPGNCGRVSCSFNSAIWWCNDNHSAKTLPSFNNIADGAQVILNSCRHPAHKGACGICWNSNAAISGQDFHSDNWNVIVRSDKC